MFGVWNARNKAMVHSSFISSLPHLPTSPSPEGLGTRLGFSYVCQFWLQVHSLPCTIIVIPSWWPDQPYVHPVGLESQKKAEFCENPNQWKTCKLVYQKFEYSLVIQGSSTCKTNSSTWKTTKETSTIHCLYMCKISMVTCILLCYTKDIPFL